MKLSTYKSKEREMQNAKNDVQEEWGDMDH
jgi:hypothetical protein